MTSHTWHILGAGSIGCLWAAHLCQAGTTPTLIVKENRYQQWCQQPVPLKYTEADQAEDLAQSFYPKVLSAKRLSGQIHRLVVCTKAQHALEAIHSVEPHLAQGCQIILLQNGMGSQQQIAKHLSHCQVWLGSVTDGAFLWAPLSVCHAGKGQILVNQINAAKNNNLEKQPSSQTWVDELPAHFGLKVTVVKDIKTQLWNKLAINCCINGLTALYNCSNGSLLDGGEKQQHLDRLITETQQALIQLDIHLKKPLRDTVYQVCDNTRNNISSTCQDVRMGRITELGFINGFLIEQMRQTPLTLTENQALLSAVEAIERNRANQPAVEPIKD